MTILSDDLRLLDAMLQDMTSAPAVYQPVEPTTGIVRDLVEELRSRPLSESLRAGSRLLNTIGAINYTPQQQMEHVLTGLRNDGKLSEEEFKTLHAGAAIIFRNSDKPLLPYELGMTTLNEAAYRAAELFGQLNGARSLSDISMSHASDSMYSFDVEGRSYSYMFLYYYMRYAYCCRFVDFSKLDNIVELGSGSGRQIDIIKSFHPHINFYAVDLPPQLYVCRQMLKAKYEADLVDYEISRKADFAAIDGKSKIVSVLPHQLERLRPKGVTLSWNSMVFCIMQKSVVHRYLELLSAFADHFYIIEPMPNTCDYKYGVSECVQFEDYVELLKPKFANVDRAKAFRPLSQMKGGWGEACDTFWSKRG